MNLRSLFNVFSKRTAHVPGVPKRLTQSFRNRVFMRCREAFSHNWDEFWSEMHSNLAYLHGQVKLSKVNARNAADDALTFLDDCSDAHYLDFVEYIFHTHALMHATGRDNLVEDFNEFLRQDDLPYAITDFVWTEGTTIAYGAERKISTLTAYPQVIRKDSTAIYQTAVQPALLILRHSDFVAANKEYLAALDDYRKADYGDCLTKCGSAFESVLKVLCVRKGWAHGATDTAAPLLKTVIAGAGMESFFEQPLILIATIRNRLSSSHGAGSTTRAVTEAKAEYAINATASAILLLEKESR